MNVTLPFASMHHEQAGDMLADMVLITNSISTEDFLETAKISVVNVVVDDGQHVHLCVVERRIAIATLYQRHSLVWQPSFIF